MGGFLSWLTDKGNDFYDSYIEQPFTTAYDAVDDYLPTLLQKNYYKPNENDLQPISQGKVGLSSLPPPKNSIPDIDAPKTSFIGDFWEGLKKGAESEWENNPLSPVNLQKAIAVPKQGLDYLGALDPLGIAGGSQVKLDENYKPVSPTLGQNVGPMLLPHRVGESPDDANPFLRRASETVTDFMADPSLAAMKLPGIAKLLLPGIVEGTASEAGNLWSMIEDQGKSITDRDVQEQLGSFIPGLVMAAQAAHGTMKEAPEIARNIPEFGVGGGYTSRSPLDFSVPNGSRQLPNFVSAMADGRSSEAPKGILDELFAAAESDPLLKRRDELKALGVLVNPTGRVPRTESLYHGTGNAWAEGRKLLNEDAINQWNESAEGYRGSVLGEAGTPELVLAAIKDPVLRERLAGVDPELIPDILQHSGYLEADRKNKFNEVGEPDFPDTAAYWDEQIDTARTSLEKILPGLTPEQIAHLSEVGGLPIPPERVADLIGQPQPEPIYSSAPQEGLNPFSSRKASSSNLHGGPFYFTGAQPVAEGSYSVAGEGQGSRPELINADVTTNKSWDLDAPVPRDIRVKALTLVNRLAQNAENPSQARYYRETYERLKQAQTGRDVESIMGDIGDRGYQPELERVDVSGLHYTTDPRTGKPVYSAKEYPLRQRPELSGKDKFLRVLESDLGYDSVKHGAKLTGGEVTIPFSRTQIKPRSAQKLAPLNERSLESLVKEYETLNPVDNSSEGLRDALKEEIFGRLADMPDPKQIEGWKKDPEHRAAFQKHLEEKVARRQEWEKTSRKRYNRLSASRQKWLDETRYARDKGEERPVWDLSKEDREWLREQDDYIGSNDWDTFPQNTERLLESLKEFNPDIYDKALDISKGKHKYSLKEPELTPEDQALLAEPVTPQSLKNPKTTVKESTTPETTDIAEWISDEPKGEPKPIPVGEWVDKAARALGYTDAPSGLSRIQGETLDPASKFIISQKKKYGKDWETKQTPEEAAFLKKLESAPEQATYEKVEPAKLSEPSEDPDIRAIQESLLSQPVKGEAEPDLSPSAEAKRQEILRGRPKKKQVDIAGEPIEKQDFLVSLSNGKSYKVRATDEVNAQEIVQDKLDSVPENKFSITGVKRKYSALESDIRTQANPTETKLADKVAGEVAKEDIAGKKAEAKAKTAEEKAKEKAQLQELRDQLKVEKQKAQAGDKEAKLREQAIAKEIRDKLKVEEDFKKAEAKRKQQEYQQKLASETGWRNSVPVKILNSAKSIAFGGDIGHLLRQGKQINVDLLFSKHAKKVAEQFPVIFKAAKSEKWFTDYHAKLAADPTIKLLTEKFGLDMPGVGKGLKEEVFHGEGLAEKIPGFGRFFAKPSERAYTAGMNFLRAAEATKLVESLKKQGKTPENNPEAYRGVARAINIITQRGDFSAKFSKQLSDASFLFGAPRAKVARIQNLVELAKGGTSGDVTRKTAAKMMAFNLGMMALLQMARKDGEFVTDPARTDFGKFRDGNLTIDPFVGLGTTARTAIQTLRAVGGEKAKSPHSGREYVMGPTDPALKELSNMTAPGVRAAWILMTGRDLGTFVTGKPAGGYLVDRAEALSQVLPLSAKQIQEILSQPGGYEKIIYSAMQAAGEGVDVFDYKKAQEEQRRLKKERGLKTKPKSSSGERAYSF